MVTSRAARVLVVDTATDAGGLKVLLQLNGYEALVTRDSEEAISAFCGFQPQVVLVDTDTLADDAAPLVRKLHQFPHDGHLTIVALADSAADPLGQAEGDFDYCLTKPVSAKALLKLLTTLEQPQAALPRKFRRPRPAEAAASGQTRVAPGAPPS